MRKTSELQNNEESIERKINMFNEKERLKWKPLRTLTIKKTTSKTNHSLDLHGFLTQQMTYPKSKIQERSRVIISLQSNRAGVCVCVRQCATLDLRAQLAS